MKSSDDTQPRSPFKTPPHAQPAVPRQPEFLSPEPEARSGPGCLLWGLVSLVIGGIALMVIVLSGVAGWTSGQRMAQGNATATQNAAIVEQLNRIPADVASANLPLLHARIVYLATLTPGVPGLADIMQTATALYWTAQPTATPSPSATPTATVPPTATLTPAAAVPDAAGGSGPRLNLPALLAEAQTAAAARDWRETLALVDVIAAADASFEAATVRRLLENALYELALQLFRFGSVGDLAEAIVLTDRLEQIGNIRELSYERFIAALYLDALNTIGTNYAAAVRALSTLYNQAPNYRDAAQLLFNEYVKYGDAWAAQSEFCPAVGPYQSALGVIADAGVRAKLTNAQTMCAQATPLPAPDVTPQPGGEQPIAPIGVPGT
jgi:hypothetical protein